MPPLMPIGPIQGTKPFEASGTGLPKKRGPQGQQNRGDAGMPQIGGFNLPELPNFTMPALNAGGGGGMPPAQPQQMLQNVPPSDRPAVDNPKNVSGWLKNLYEDIYGFAAAIPATFKVAAQSGVEIAKNWKYLDDIFLNHPEMLTRELDTTARQVVKGFTDTYEHGLGEALYKHPFSVLLDATGVIDIMGAGIKTAGKAAMKVGVKADEAAKIIALGRNVQELPGRMLKAPFIKSAKMMEKVPAAQKIMSSFALDELGRNEARQLGSYLLEEKALVEPGAKRLFGNKIKSENFQHYDDALSFLPDSQIKDPAILERKKEWKAMVAEDERNFVDLGIKTPEELAKAKLKDTALKLKQKGIFKGELYTYVPDELTGELKIGGFTDEAYDAAKRWVDGENPWGEKVEGVYKQFMQERTFNLDELLEALGTSEKGEGFRKWVSRFEKKTGKSPVVMDPDLWQARSIMQKSQLMGTLKYWQDAMQRLGKPIKAGGKADDGFVIAPPFLEKYVAGGLPNAMDLLRQRMTEAVTNAQRSGGDRALAMKGAIKQTHSDLMARANDLKDELAQVTADPKSYSVQIPKQVAYLMQKSMFGPRGIWRFYDNVLNTWRDAILTFMPRYYINNLLGNAVLLMFAGHTPMNKVGAMKVSDLPGEAMNSMLATEGGAASSFLAMPFQSFQKPFRRAAAAAADVTDSRAKQVALGTLSRDVIAKQAELGNLTAKGLQVMETAEDANAIMHRARREFLGSPLEELRLTRKAAASGEFETLFKPNVRVDPVRKAQVENLTRDIAQLENRIKFEKNLVSTVPDMKGGYKTISRVEELRSQIKMKSEELSRINPNVPVAQMVGPQIHNMPELAKLSELQLRRQALKPYAELAEKAILDMEGFFGNYGRLHPIEREWVRRAIPFWTFSKTMFKLAFNLPFLRPKTSFLWNQFSKLMVDAIGDDRLPNRFRNMVPIGGDEEGNIIFLKIGGFNPFEQVAKTSSVGGVGIPQFIDPRNNPLVKIAVESIGGYDLFTEKPFVRPTDFVSLNGSVKRYDPQLRRIETVIPQKPILDSVFQQVPHMKVLAELVEAAGLGADYLGTEFRRNPDGTLTYNRQWWHALSRASGFPVTTQNPEKVRMQHELLKRGMVKRFRSASGRVDPETRLQLESILRNLEQAEVYE